MKKFVKILLVVTICLSFGSCFGCGNNTSSSKYSGSGSYTSPTGRKQEQYQGSIEQKRDLDMIDEYFNEHGWD